MNDKSIDAETIALAKRLATKAGDLLLSMRSRANATLETKAHENDFVSAADRASETLIVTIQTPEAPGIQH